MQQNIPEEQEQPDGPEEPQGEEGDQGDDEPEWCLRECESHGYFRGIDCPICSQEGKFLMSEQEIDRLGRVMAGILRHFPERFNVKMDTHGWVDIQDLVTAVRQSRDRMRWLRRHHIHAMALTDEKGRYQVDGERVRATYGHSIDLDLDLPTDQIPELLYYPAAEEEADLILDGGLKPSDRKNVHLSRTYRDAAIAGSFRGGGNPVILQIDTRTARKEGMVIKRAGKTVFLSGEVSPKYLARAPVQEVDLDGPGEGDGGGEPQN